MRAPIELRYADMPWGRELDEIVVRGGMVVAENMGGYVAAILYEDAERFQGRRHVQISFHVEWIPRAMWRDEIVDAWYGREWPTFRRVVMRVMDDHTPPEAAP